MERILIIGAASAIAEATAQRFAARGAHLYLLARDQERLASLARDLSIRGAGQVAHAPFDARTFDRHQPLLEAVIAELGGLDTVLIAYGTLGDQKACENSVALTLQELNINALSVIAWLTVLAPHFEAQRQGRIAVIGSVAGDRGRQSNYVYGTAKGALAIFLQGLRNRLHKCGVQVLTIKPGFVDTPMTAALPKGPLWASPEKIAEDIDKALNSRRNVLYSPSFWWLIMGLIRSVPESLFKRLSL